MATTGTRRCGRRCTLLCAGSFSVVAHAAGAAAALLIPGGSADATPVPIEVSLLPADVIVAPAPPVLRQESLAIPRRSPSPRTRFTRPTTASPFERPPPPAPPASAVSPGQPSAVLAPTAFAPVQLTAAAAHGLRVYDEFPDLPSTLRHAGAAYAVTAEICVSPSGQVERVRFRDSPPRPFEPVLRAALFAWRYSSLIRDRVPVRFCHGIQLQYQVPSRTSWWAP
jgi:hypothetical protein